MAKDWLGRWAERNVPRREDLARSRWLKPFGKRIFYSEYWRFTRRSVPRGVAVGLWFGIFALIPGIQIVGSALLSLPFRANIPVAAAMTFLSNPFTTPFILAGSYFVGKSVGFGGTEGVPGREAGLSDWMTWLFSDAALATVSGLLIVASVSALLGYLISIFVWRWWQGRKWRRRGVQSRSAD